MARDNADNPVAKSSLLTAASLVPGAGHQPSGARKFQASGTGGSCLDEPKAPDWS